MNDKVLVTYTDYENLPFTFFISPEDGVNYDTLMAANGCVVNATRGMSDDAIALIADISTISYYLSKISEDLPNEQKLEQAHQALEGPLETLTMVEAHEILERIVEFDIAEDGPFTDIIHIGFAP